MQVTGRCRRWMTAITLALVVGGYGSRAEAAINLVEKDGWSANFEGFLNMFLVDTFGEAPPPGVFDVWSAPTDDNIFRLRTGFRSMAGVKIDLIVRGMCCLRPGVQKISEKIQVISVVGRFLEHSRIYYARNGGKEETLLGSADLMPRNIKLILEYDGTNYHGWQSQQRSGKATVQDALEEALRKLTKEDIRTVSSGRTDAGVHALGHVANFLTESGIPASAWAPALNSRLPADIRVLASEEADPEFHARFSAKGKQYRYLILARRAPSALHQETRVACGPEAERFEHAAGGRAPDREA